MDWNLYWTIILQLLLFIAIFILPVGLNIVVRTSAVQKKSSTRTTKIL